MFVVLLIFYFLTTSIPIIFMGVIGGISATSSQMMKSIFLDRSDEIPTGEEAGEPSDSEENVEGDTSESVTEKD